MRSLTPDDSTLDVELAVVGAGAGGLYTALRAARSGARVALVSATPLAASASYWAQGGLAASFGEDDSPERHLEDTVRAGRGAVRHSAAEVLVAEAPAAVRDLESLGVRFDCDADGELALGLEGGHSARRVVHAGGAATGRRVIRRLAALVAEDERITLLDGQRVVALTLAGERCVGLLTAQGVRVRARAVVLATGGAAALWARTTNPHGTTGHGLLLAHAAGAELADLELVQFHPTAVAAAGAAWSADGIDGFLVSEAVRGEGATLHAIGGERFIDELAPRDEVAHAIQRVLTETGEASVALDMTAIDLGSFPSVVSRLRRAGLDPAHERVPVAPAAHYMMGGIATDLSARTSVPGLLAVGECACSGVHGANRLASNSLSECLVLGARAATAALEEPAAPAGEPLRDASAGPKPPALERSRAAVWEHAGLVRDEAGLRVLATDPHPLARLVAACALARRESRGAHERSDFPQLDPAFDLCHTVVGASGEVELAHWE